MTGMEIVVLTVQRVGANVFPAVAAEGRGRVWHLAGGHCTAMSTATLCIRGPAASLTIPGLGVPPLGSSFSKRRADTHIDDDLFHPWTGEDSFTCAFLKRRHDSLTYVS